MKIDRLKAFPRRSAVIARTEPLSGFEADTAGMVAFSGSADLRAGRYGFRVELNKEEFSELLMFYMSSESGQRTVSRLVAESAARHTEARKRRERRCRGRAR